MDRQAFTNCPGKIRQGYAASLVAMRTSLRCCRPPGYSCKNLPNSFSLCPLRRPVPACSTLHCRQAPDISSWLQYIEVKWGLACSNSRDVSIFPEHEVWTGEERKARHVLENARHMASLRDFPDGQLLVVVT